MYAQIYERSPMRVFEESTKGGLAPGELGAVVGRAGTGKSALLVHLALDRLLDDQRVLHISLKESADHVRGFYNAIFEGVARAARVRGRERDRARLQMEKHRQILCFLDRDFGTEDFAKAIGFAEEIMHFLPTAVVLDGLAPGSEAQLHAIRALAQEKGFAVWSSLRSHRDQAGSWPFEGSWDTAVHLEPVDTLIELRVHKVHGSAPASSPTGLHLDPTTMLVTGEDGWDPLSAPPSPRAMDCTLYSGGASGAEAAFGSLAERYGLNEMNFTFEGHEQAHTRGSHVLTERELAAGDVSLLYVSKRLHRSWDNGDAIKPVLQSLWHQVSRAQQVFVIGTIQDDDTVVGGTGWSVELARMWHKDLWVFDQERRGWHRWNGSSWVGGVPVIESPHFCGTGTRALNEASERAIELLFERSFGVPR